MESTFVLLQKVEMFSKKSQKRLWHQGKCGRMRRRWTQFYNQSPTKKNLGPRRQSTSIFQKHVKIFFTIHTIDDPSYSTDTLGLNEWIGAVWTKPEQQSSRRTPTANHQNENILDFSQASWDNLEKKPEKRPSRLYLKSSKKTSTGREYLTWQKIVSKKMKRFHKGNHFKFERNGTFFLQLRRFFKIPHLEFALRGCNLTNFS